MPKTIKAIQEGQQPNLFENWATTSFRVSLLNSSMGRVWGRCGGLVVPKGSGPKGEWSQRGAVPKGSVALVMYYFF